jgi:hypothetical protein
VSRVAPYPFHQVQPGVAGLLLHDETIAHG